MEWFISTCTPRSDMGVIFGAQSSPKAYEYAPVS